MKTFLFFRKVGVMLSTERLSTERLSTERLSTERADA